jgi:hypothetical protein
MHFKNNLEKKYVKIFSHLSVLPYRHSTFHCHNKNCIIYNVTVRSFERASVVHKAAMLVLPMTVKN